VSGWLASKKLGQRKREQPQDPHLEIHVFCSASADSALLALLTFVAQLALAFADFFWLLLTFADSSWLLAQGKSFQIQRAGEAW
jgi:hypothetical protein